MKLRHQRPRERTALHTASMIDVVFLLLVFFLLTFQITALEGDFFVRMSRANDAEPRSRVKAWIPHFLRQFRGLLASVKPIIARPRSRFALLMTRD